MIALVSKISFKWLHFKTAASTAAASWSRSLASAYMPLAITVENLPCIAICVASAMPEFLQFHSHTQKLEPSTLHTTTNKTKV